MQITTTDKIVRLVKCRCTVNSYLDDSAVSEFTPAERENFLASGVRTAQSLATPYWRNYPIDFASHWRTKWN